MNEFSAYRRELERLALSGQPAPAKAFAPALDGEAGRELRLAVALDTRREHGAFFTGSKLAEKLRARVKSGEAWQDPACGAGDLLLAAARQLPIGPSLRATVSAWSRRLAGSDLHAEFVRATKARLVLMARSRGVFTEKLPKDYLKKIFPEIKQRDALGRNGQPWPNATILMNPPFYATAAPRGTAWAKAGDINVAAIFLTRYLEKAAAGTRILAILPEVLRSGSNYRMWRDHVAALCSQLAFESWGLFDANADVDVFMLDITKKAKEAKATTWPRPRSSTRALDMKFEVSVGAVVPHRHKRRGILRRFLDARSAPSGGTVRRVKERRKFKGTVVVPPFVVVKRTSRPGDKFRAAATVVTGTQPVAVENHLIVCQPKDRKLASCQKLAKQLQSERVNRALNRAIRCRHLTVGAVKRITLPVG